MSHNPAPDRFVMGLFTDEVATVTALNELKHSPFALHRVHGPYPSHRILDALALPNSRVGYFTLTGGILGFLSGYAISIYSTLQWKLIVSGKPVVSLLPYFVVGYEMTILFGILGTVIGLLISTRLPGFKGLKEIYDERCSGEHFGIVAVCSPGDEDRLAQWFLDRGGIARRFESAGS